MKIRIPVIFLILIAILSCRTGYEHLASIGKYRLNINDIKAAITPQTKQILDNVDGETKIGILKNVIDNAIEHKVLYLIASRSDIKVERDERYYEVRRTFNELRKPFLLQLNVPEKEIDRLFEEYWAQVYFIEKSLKTNIVYTKDELTEFYEENKSTLFTVKPFIRANRISIKIDDPAKTIDMTSQLNSLVKKYRDYELLKENVHSIFGDNVYFIENTPFSKDLLKVVFENSPEEVDNIFKTEINTYTDVYDAFGGIFVFLILEKQKEDIIQGFDEIQDFVLKNFIDHRIIREVSALSEKFKRENPINVLYDKLEDLDI